MEAVFEPIPSNASGDRRQRKNWRDHLFAPPDKSRISFQASGQKSLISANTKWEQRRIANENIAEYVARRWAKLRNRIARTQHQRRSSRSRGLFACNWTANLKASLNAPGLRHRPPDTQELTFFVYHSDKLCYRKIYRIAYIFSPVCLRVPLENTSL